ncbi:MAG: type II secretion system protein, partial [Candidatus Accumulibacter phosphatis]
MQRGPWKGLGGEMGNSRSMLCAHRTIPACKPECARQGRETVMTFIIGGVLQSHDRLPGVSCVGRHRQGFTLIELLVVLSIIALLLT